MAHTGRGTRCPCLPCREYKEFLSILLRRQDRERVELMKQYNARCRNQWAGGPPAYWDAPPAPEWSPVPLLDFNLNTEGWEARWRFCMFLRGVSVPAQPPGVGSMRPPVSGGARRRQAAPSPFIQPSGYVWAAPTLRPDGTIDPIGDILAAAAAVPRGVVTPEVVSLEDD
jgi:hypothetical protein